MSSRSLNRQPLANASTLMNKNSPSIHSRNYSSKNLSTSKDKMTRTLNPVVKPSHMKQSIKTEFTRSFEPENIEPVVEANPDCKKQNPVQPQAQSRNLEDLLKSTNASLDQLRVELVKLEHSTVEDKPKIQEEPVIRVLGDYHKELVKEMREENHKLIIDDLKIKTEITRMKDTNIMLNTENATLKERLASEKLKNELLEHELANTSRKNAELSFKVEILEKDTKLSIENEAKDLELKRKEEIIRTLIEQMSVERESKMRMNAELNLELTRNGKLQVENEKLKMEGKQLHGTLLELKGEIDYLKTSNQEVLAMLRYR